MNAVEFMKNMSRICKNNICTYECPLRDSCHNSYDKWTEESIEAIAKAVEDWLETHPTKTRQTEFLKEFPQAAVVYGTIDILPCKFDKSLAKDCNGGAFGACSECKKAYWDEVVE